MEVRVKDSRKIQFNDERHEFAKASDVRSAVERSVK